ncbi:MAG: Ldh family oxidoreductase [Rhodospirillales bacterium]|nr:Ldh family oxidoreductase [Rhodospirillales bacterium]
MALQSLVDLRDLALKVLVASETSPENAEMVASALVRADADNIPSHGVARLPTYADQATSGKTDGFATPEISQVASAVIRVDAKNGFAYPAIALGLARAVDIVTETGVVAVAVGNSSHGGVLGHHVEDMADRGLAALGFVNTPAAISPWGGNRPLYGTDPIAFACPRRDLSPLVIDLSLTKVARGKIKLAADRGEPIAGDVATDADGKLTTDAAQAMAGSLLPIGDAKGAALALMVEILTATMTGSNYGFEASSFFSADGPPPNTGQFFILFNPESLGGEGFAGRIEVLMAAILNQPGTRLPGDRRLENRRKAEKDGVDIPDALLADLKARAGG